MNFEGSLLREFSSSCRPAWLQPPSRTCVHTILVGSVWLGTYHTFVVLINLAPQRSQASRLWLVKFCARAAHTHMYVDQIPRAGWACVQDSPNLLWCSSLIAVSAFAFVICAIPSAAADGANEGQASQIPHFEFLISSNHILRQLPFSFPSFFSHHSSAS